MTSAREIAGLSPVIPVITPPDPERMVAMARAILEGGIRTVEITLRTPTALDAIRAVRASVPDLVVGAGTVLEPAQLETALEAGAQFIVTPGLTPDLLESLIDAPVPVVPGVSTVSETMLARYAGFSTLKFFPAGDRKDFLAALAAPFPDLTFCPTGGIDLQSAADWLALPNVICIGGSWLTPAEFVVEQAWGRIRERAAEAAALRVTA